MKKYIAILAGGYSGEFDISVKSARVVYQHIDREQFEPYIVTVYPDRWIVETGKDAEVQVDLNEFSVLLNGKKIRFDVVFIAIHGTPGEDGKLQGYFDMLGIPYTSSDAVVSALTFNKYFCKKVVETLGIQTAKSYIIRSRGDVDEERMRKIFTLPLFVKPNNNGSSVGASRVNLWTELEPAIDRAFEADHEILVEEFIAGREITCGVLREHGKVIALPLTEVISKKEFFDYEAKYTPGMADEVTPAEIDPELASQCQRLSEYLYTELNCKGVARFDYILTPNGFVFLEVNTVPGLTEDSIVPRMARAHGWNLSYLFTLLIRNCLV